MRTVRTVMTEPRAKNTHAGIRILILDSSATDAEHITASLAKNSLRAETKWVSTKAAFTDAVETFAPDVVLCESLVSHFSAVDVLEVLRATRPVTPVIVVAASPDPRDTVASVRAGVEDVVPKTHLSRLAASVHAALKTRKRLELLSPRQLQVLTLIAEGNTTREIAKRLRVSVKTAETHRTEVMKRLDLHDVVSVVRYAIRVGLVPATEI
jgi:DNA-binding NarL/FixJ family response regulator